MQLFPAQISGARQLPHPRKPPMPHNDGSATDRASAWRARKSSADWRANCSVCLRLHWVGGSFFFPATAQQWLPGRGCPGALHCSGTTTTPNGRVPALRDCGLANWRGLHTACSEPARANCSMCHPVLGAFSKKGWSALLLAPNEVTAPEAGDSQQVQIARTWLKAGTERTATRCSEPGRAI